MSEPTAVPPVTGKPAVAAPPGEHRRRLRQVTGGAIGNAIENFDFNLYGFLALYLGTAFFPAGEPSAVLVSTYGVFALTFLARPLGAVVFGSLGDRIGRKPTLILVLLLMSGATCAIAVLPGYAAIGIAAPVLLIAIRFVQALSAGSEIGGSLTVIVEAAPTARRGLVASAQNISAYTGGLAATGVVALLTLLLPEAGMASYGWRVAFLVAVPLGVVALLLRRRITETQKFLEVASHSTPRTPIRDLVRSHRRQLLVCIALSAGHVLPFYLMFTYFSNAAKIAYPELARPIALALPLIYVVALLVLPFAATLSDRIGRKRIIAAACVGHLVLSLPIGWMFLSGSVAGVFTAAVVFGVVFGVYSSAPWAAMVELFPTRMRMTGMSVGYSLGAVILGGTAPLVGTELVAWTGQPLAPSCYIMAIAVVILVALRFMDDMAGRELT